MAAPRFAGLIWRDGLFVPGEFTVADGKIVGLKPAPKTPSVYIIPPYADPHIHGGWGLSFQDGDFLLLEQKLLEHGIAFAIPTLQNATLNSLKNSALAFKKYQQENPGSIFPFLRMEGPFISFEKKGFQRDEFILAADPSSIQEFLEIEELGLFTFAPEQEGMDKLVTQALVRNKIPSFGHSQASYEDFLRFYRMGVRHMTHYPNAMRGLHHREIGLVGAGLLHTDLQLEVIADGIHNSLDFLRLLLHIRGPSFALASDMIPPAFAENSEFDGRRLQHQGRLYTTEEGILAGGSTTISEQVHLLWKAGIPPEQLVPLACLNTRQVFGLPVPQLAAEQEASYLVLDDRFVLQEVYYRGNRL